MNTDPLDDLLKSYAQHNLPSAGRFLHRDVWAAIERKRDSFWSRLAALDWREVFAEPRLVVAAVAIAFAVGALPVALSGAPNRPRLARESLHLDVFSVAAASVLERSASGMSAMVNR